MSTGSVPNGAWMENGIRAVAGPGITNVQRAHAIHEGQNGEGRSRAESNAGRSEKPR